MREQYPSVDRDTAKSVQARRAEIPRLRASPTFSRRACALAIFFVDLLHHLEFQIAFGDEFLESRIPLFQLPKPSNVERLKLSESLAPEVYGLFGDPVLLGRLGDRPCISFPPDPNHLLFGKSCLLYRFLLPGESHLPKNQSVRK
jgi:hypothetical protein